MVSKRSYEEIVTDQLTESDWVAIFSLKLDPLHRAYLQVFKDNNNRPMDRREVINKLIANKVITSSEEKVYFDAISNALKRRKTPYRVRAISKAKHAYNPFRVVRVSPSIKED